ncbi:MAG: hypothetical protein ACJ79O_00805 [Myxococcales bacterium]
MRRRREERALPATGRGRRPQQTIAAVLTVASFVGFAAWEMTRDVHPWADLSSGYFTDHLSHMNDARHFPRAGIRHWTTPLAQMEPRLTKAQRAVLPRDIVDCPDGCLFHVDGWPDQKPMQQSWPLLTRFYPPGDLLLFAPVAALYQFTPIRSSTVNRLLVILCLAFAHAGIFVILDRVDGLVAAVCALLGASALVHWSLEGFYDAAIVVPLLLCDAFLAAGLGASALLAFGLAMLIHFRALYYVPWGVAAAVLVLRGHRRPEVAKVAVAAVCLCVSVATFGLSLPGLLAYPLQLNPLLGAADPKALLEAAGVAALAIGVFLWARSPLDAGIVAWLALVLTHVRQNYSWYTMALVPWLCAPSPKPAVRLARLAVFAFLAVRIHQDPLWPHWIGQVHA